MTFFYGDSVPIHDAIIRRYVMTGFRLRLISLILILQGQSFNVMSWSGQWVLRRIIWPFMTF